MDAAPTISGTQRSRPQCFTPRAGCPRRMGPRPSEHFCLSASFSSIAPRTAVNDSGLDQGCKTPGRQKFTISLEITGLSLATLPLKFSRRSARFLGDVMGLPVLMSNPSPSRCRTVTKVLDSMEWVWWSTGAEHCLKAGRGSVLDPNTGRNR